MEFVERKKKTPSALFFLSALLLAALGRACLRVARLTRLSGRVECAAALAVSPRHNHTRPRTRDRGLPQRASSRLLTGPNAKARASLAPSEGAHTHTSARSLRHKAPSERCGARRALGRRLPFAGAPLHVATLRRWSFLVRNKGPPRRAALRRTPFPRSRCTPWRCQGPGAPPRRGRPPAPQGPQPRRSPRQVARARGSGAAAGGAQVAPQRTAGVCAAAAWRMPSRESPFQTRRPEEGLKHGKKKRVAGLSSGQIREPTRSPYIFIFVSRDSAFGV